MGIEESYGYRTSCQGKKPVSAKDVGRMKERKLVGGYPPEKEYSANQDLHPSRGKCTEYLFSFKEAGHRNGIVMGDPIFPTFRGLFYLPVWSSLPLREANKRAAERHSRHCLSLTALWIQLSFPRNTHALSEEVTLEVVESDGSWNYLAFRSFLLEFCK
ncbi:hypothetical protein CEXT_597981 [Caerostris extrusa]|uniref:Uncharacterized protein n=1 Tax=Caerostris extrusa TaxID=172846 RepID=A0AAV4NUA2_CAEEX|nr:hypothetical protein CEXT_597981 [Caerostris extrusa]